MSLGAGCPWNDIILVDSKLVPFEGKTFVTYHRTWYTILESNNSCILFWQTVFFVAKNVFITCFNNSCKVIMMQIILGIVVLHIDYNFGYADIRTLPKHQLQPILVREYN